MFGNSTVAIPLTVGCSGDGEYSAFNMGFSVVSATVLSSGIISLFTLTQEVSSIDKDSRPKWI